MKIKQTSSFTLSNPQSVNQKVEQFFTSQGIHVERTVAVLSSKGVVALKAERSPRVDLLKRILHVETGMELPTYIESALKKNFATNSVVLIDPAVAIENDTDLTVSIFACLPEQADEVIMEICRRLTPNWRGVTVGPVQVCLPSFLTWADLPLGK